MTPKMAMSSAMTHAGLDVCVSGRVIRCPHQFPSATICGGYTHFCWRQVLPEYPFRAYPHFMSCVCGPAYQRTRVWSRCAVRCPLYSPFSINTVPPRVHLLTTTIHSVHSVHFCFCFLVFGVYFGASPWGPDPINLCVFWQVMHQPAPAPPKSEPNSPARVLGGVRQPRYHLAGAEPSRAWCPA